MRGHATLAIAVLLMAPLTGCLVPQNMTQLREDLGYASVDRPELVVKARASSMAPTVNETVTLTADVEGVPPANASVTWTIDGQAREGRTVETVFETPGTVEASATASVDDVTASDTITLDVTPNRAPVPSIDLPDRGSLTDTEPVRLDGQASSDPDGDALSYAWTVDGEAVGQSETVDVDLDPGVHRATLTVDDGLVDATQQTQFAVDQVLAAEGTVSTGDDTMAVGFEVREGAEGLEVAFEHTTTAGMDDVDLTLVDADGTPVATASGEPEPGASTASQTLEASADELAPGAYTLEATLERGTDAELSWEGAVAYAPPG